MLTQTENYSTNMFLMPHLVSITAIYYSRNAIYTYNDESTVKPQNSTESDTEKLTQNIVVSSKLDKIYSFVN